MSALRVNRPGKPAEIVHLTPPPVVPVFPAPRRRPGTEEQRRKWREYKARERGK